MTEHIDATGAADSATEPAPAAGPDATPSEPAPAAGATTPPAEPAPAAGGTTSPTEPAPAPEATTPPAEPAPPTGEHPVPARPPRRALRAALRWTTALLTFAAFATGTAYAVAGMERTDVPGLATESDGRWDYPTLTKPPLPSGSPGPFADTNKTGSHYADLRRLVLPAPHGATLDKGLAGRDGWLSTTSFLARYDEKDDRDELAQKFTDYGLRHIAARGWTTPDGTRTAVYLLQFDSAAVLDELTRDLAPYGGPGYPLRGAVDSVADEDFPDASLVTNVSRVAYVESKPYGKEQTRQAYLAAGDVLALVVQDRKGSAHPVPFQQTVTLQSQLLA
ncbi:hypothetical protein [Streptomyces griseorubiginosus]|uniref:hypothetical protein n=1 Tax=Streptomyces griseorubiginosus TaxID=67304 RepID=UPI0036E965AB